MIDELTLIQNSVYTINDNISIHIPSLKEICEYGEQRYYNLVYSLCATPSDYKVQLLDMYQIDYEKIDDFTLFSTLCCRRTQEETSILFGNLNLKNFTSILDNKTGELILHDKVNGIIIDNSIYTLMTNYLRQIHGFKKNSEFGGNEHTKKYLIEKERRRLQRKQHELYTSTLNPLISSMVNSSAFKYDYSTVWNLSIYTFLDSVKRIQKHENYNHVMQGVYTGNIDSKSLSKEIFNWMGAFNEG